METLAEAMNRVRQHADLGAYCEDNLRRAPRGNSPFACPACGSGASGRQNSNTAFTITGEKWHCHACERGGDVFDLAGIIHGTEDRAEQCDLVAEWAGVDGWSGGDHDRNGDRARRATPGPGRGATGDGDAPGRYAEGRARHRAYILAAQANIGHPDAMAYLSSRGIDLETARAWGLGYDPDAGGAKNASGDWCRRGRIVIPWAGSEHYHIDRAIAPDVATAKYHKPRSEEVGPQPLWDPDAIKEPVFFVVEGALDALAVRSCGYPAVALGSTGDTDLVAAMRDAGGAGVAVLMLDNDGPGRKAQADLETALDAAGLLGLAISDEDAEELARRGKDPDELRMRHPDVLAAYLKAAHDAALELREAKGEEARRKRMERYHIVDPGEAVRTLYDLKEGRAPIPSGLAMLDKLTGGGLHAKSLHVIGAQSSEGKTTLTLQVADHVARSGHPVLFVTVEQRSSELIAKSLARIARARSGGTVTLTARAIGNPMERARWTAGEWQTLTDACNEYAEEVAPSVLFMDPDEPPTVRAIWEAARAMADARGEAPVVFVDYLQILAADAGHERDSEKQVTDRNVTLLRRMAGGLNTPVWVVASLNRASYTSPITTDSFKESGAIEYGSDVLMGLEPFDLETRWHNATDKKRPITAKALHDKTRRATRRWMDLKVMKNRFGSLPDTGLPFVYHADSDTFETLWRVNRAKRAEDPDADMGEPLGWDDGVDDGDGLVM